jgi:hypothetical protein
MLLATGLLGLVIGVIVTTVVRKPPIDETRFVNFDTGSRALLGAGFSNPEGSGDDAFAWCSARTCKVTVYSRGEVDRTIAFQAAPYSFPNAPQQSVTVLLNGAPLGSHKLPGGVSVMRVKAPKATWLLGPNELRFDFGYAEAPKDHVPGNGDPRKLAAAFVWIAMTGPAAPAASASAR